MLSTSMTGVGMQAGSTTPLVSSPSSTTCIIVWPAKRGVSSRCIADSRWCLDLSRNEASNICSRDDVSCSAEDGILLTDALCGRAVTAAASVPVGGVGLVDGLKGAISILILTGNVPAGSSCMPRLGN